MPRELHPTSLGPHHHGSVRRNGLRFCAKNHNAVLRWHVKSSQYHPHHKHSGVMTKSEGEKKSKYSEEMQKKIREAKKVAKAEVLKEFGHTESEEDKQKRLEHKKNKQHTSTVEDKKKKHEQQTALEKRISAAKKTAKVKILAEDDETNV
ncbi:hypothetical protein PROFUN_05334 [Planoprotostelium fungivorum]|uniref:Uncharacterized protein n=1 Tax=Planoprotostelium fungivorum TaxID=1890364 RepID=A0A2P6NR36_9EUKA|nr:hypothetical protein PROFUN_05334 [Planoprotostelium fungivorum]